MCGGGTPAGADEVHLLRGLLILLRSLAVLKLGCGWQAPVGKERQ